MSKASKELTKNRTWMNSKANNYTSSAAACPVELPKWRMAWSGSSSVNDSPRLASSTNSPPRSSSRPAYTRNDSSTVRGLLRCDEDSASSSAPFSPPERSATRSLRQEGSRGSQTPNQDVHLKPAAGQRPRSQAGQHVTNLVYLPGGCSLVAAEVQFFAASTIHRLVCHAHDKQAPKALSFLSQEAAWFPDGIADTPVSQHLEAAVSDGKIFEIPEDLARFVQYAALQPFRFGPRSKQMLDKIRADAGKWRLSAGQLALPAPPTAARGRYAGSRGSTGLRACTCV
ncbi:unnamed protein product [Symbiodinium sp. KB8]|nr:unnamed protein product [Symbiodinium sp. KB8]